jgi:HEAT repeat protein
VPRFALIVGTLGLVSLLTGCASTWDTLTSKRFQNKPFGTMFGSEDPMTVLRNNPDGEDRARAMLKLKEPILNGKGEAEQDEAMQILHAAATTDSSPWVRIAAIETLGKFKDPRAVPTLTQAFHTSTGSSVTPAPEAPPSPIEQASLTRPARLPDRYGLAGPQGFPSDQVMNIRGRVVESLAKSNHPDAVAFLAEVAKGRGQLINEEPSARGFVRQRAVAGLSQMRHKDSVVALSEVLASEHNKDLTLTNLAHTGLVGLTGKKLPANPEQWGEVVQAGNFEVVPEPNAIQRAIGLSTP